MKRIMLGVGVLFAALTLAYGLTEITGNNQDDQVDALVQGHNEMVTNAASPKVTAGSLIVQTNANVGGTANIAGAITASNNVAVGGALTVEGGQTNTGSIVTLGRYPILGKDKTTQFAIESGSSTGTAVVVYTTPFSATPQVFITPTVQVAADATNWVAIQTNPRTNFTTTALGTSTFNWLAIGPK